MLPFCSSGMIVLTTLLSHTQYPCVLNALIRSLDVVFFGVPHHLVIII